MDLQEIEVQFAELETAGSEKKNDKNLVEQDVAKKRITDSKEFFNYTNKSDSKKQDMWWINARD